MKQILKLATILALLVVASNARAQDVEKVRESLIAARTAYDSGNYRTAIDKIKVVETEIGSTTKPATAYIKIMSYYKLKDYQNCVDAANAYLADKPAQDETLEEIRSVHSKAQQGAKQTLANKRSGEVYNPDGIELVYVEGNGSIKSFFIGKFEITQAQWRNIMGSNPSNFKGDNLPVEKVSWDDVQVFLSKLNAKTGGEYRLPVKAEWDFAAKGGKLSRKYNYSGSNNGDAVAWFKENSGGSTHPIGTKQPNELGVYDMNGNVSEWCQDRSNTSSARLHRGNSWTSNSAKSANTFFKSPDYRLNTIGFRLVLPVKK